MKIDHLGIATNSINDGLAFWRDALGLELHETEEVAELIRTCNEMIQQQKYPESVTCFQGAMRRFPEQAQLHYHAAFAFWYKALHNADGKRRSSMEKVAYRNAIREFEVVIPNNTSAGQTVQERIISLLEELRFEERDDGFQARRRGLLGVFQGAWGHLGPEEVLVHLGNACIGQELIGVEVDR